MITGVVLLAAVALVVVLIVKPFGGSTATGDLGLVPPGHTIDPTLASGRTLSKGTPSVTVDEWADFQCPSCKVFTTSIQPALITDVVQTGIAKFSIHDFTFIGQESFDAAVGVRCADEQGKFWDYHDWLFANQGASENAGAFASARLDKIADLIGLDRPKFDACRSAGTALAAVQAETAQGQKLGIDSTPTVFINGQKATFKTYNELLAAIKAAAGISPSASASAPPAAASQTP